MRSHSVPARPTLLQHLCEMLHVARECTSRPPPAGSTGSPSQHSLLSFGEFCLFSQDLQPPSYHSPSSPTQSSRPSLLMRQCSDRGHRDSNRPDKKSKCSSSPPCQVFLGGSCNPTSWRQDVAIPALRELGISFYNPQVTNWEEALVEREHQAKSTASVLFFVFDRRTRNVASMVEVAYMAACPRKIMLVLDTYPGPGHPIGGEPISQREYEELCGGLNTVQDLVERRGIPVFSQLNHALNCTAKILREDLWPQQLGVADNVTPVKFPHLQLGDKYSKIQAAFGAHGSSCLPLSEARHVFRAVVGRELSQEELLTVIAAKKGVTAGSISACTELPLKDVSITLDDFCCIVAEFSSPRLEQRRLRDVFTNSVVSPLQRALGLSSPRRSLRHLSAASPFVSTNHSSCNGGSVAPVYDVYLGGATATSNNWREAVALPTLRKHGLTFCSPSSSPVSSPAPLTTALLHNSTDTAQKEISRPLREDRLGKLLENSIDHASNSERRHNSHDLLPINSSNAPDRGVHERLEDGSEYSRRQLDCSSRSRVEADCDRHGRLYPSEAAHIDQCRVVLFVITDNTRCVSAMTLASHYVGLGCNVVLCVQKLPDNAVVDGELLTKTATKDYNRGRSYLTDQAVKDGVPVFTDIAEALECVVQKCAASR